MADQIIFVQALHDDDNGAVLFVVLPAVEGVVVPVISGVPLGIGERLLGFQWIVDQNDVGAAPGQHPTIRGSETIAVPGGDELSYRLAIGGEPGREDPPVPGAGHDAPAIAGELVGKVLGIADTEELGRGIVAQAPGRKRDRGQQRLQMARRQVDDQAPDLALAYRGKLGGDDLDVPVHPQLGLRVELIKAARGEGGEVLP
jgi:hypothetical protein